jgi:hypothetical protein
MTEESGETALNGPEKIPGTIYRGSSAHISKAESKQRIVIMERLLASGQSDAAIEEVMEKKFGINEKACRRYRQRVYEKWASEDAERGAHLKTAARRRIYDHLEGARRAKQWSAVANLEKILSGIEGTTIDPKEATTPTEVRIREATLSILNEADPNWVVEIIEREMKISGGSSAELAGRILESKRGGNADDTADQKIQARKLGKKSDNS